MKHLFTLLALFLAGMAIILASAGYYQTAGIALAAAFLVMAFRPIDPDDRK
jgi:phosphatidylserine synthase